MHIATGYSIGQLGITNHGNPIDIASDWIDIKHVTKCLPTHGKNVAGESKCFLLPLDKVLRSMLYGTLAVSSLHHEE